SVISAARSGVGRKSRATPRAALSGAKYRCIAMDRSLQRRVQLERMRPAGLYSAAYGPKTGRAPLDPFDDLGFGRPLCGISHGAATCVILRTAALRSAPAGRRCPPVPGHRRGRSVDTTPPVLGARRKADESANGSRRRGAYASSTAQTSAGRLFVV